MTFKDEKSVDNLPFSPPKQLAVLGHLMINNDWWLQAFPLMNPEWFENATAQRLFSIKARKHQKSGHPPSYEEMLANNEIQTEQPTEKAALIATLKIAKIRSEEFNLTVLSDELTEWMHAVIFKRASEKAQNSFNGKNLVQAYSMVEQMLMEIKTSSFGTKASENFDDFLGEFAENEAEYSDALTFGLDIFDRLLTPKAQKGSLLRGDSSIILAPVNCGKTSVCINVAIENIKLGKDVLLITHEDRPSSIKEKIRCRMLGKSSKTLYEGYKMSDGKAKELFMALLLDAHATLKKHLTYIPMNQAGLTVEEVAAVVRRKQEEKLLLTKKGYDLFVDDYPAKLISGKLVGNYTQKRNMDDYVYQFFVQLALENNWHSLAAIQTNREGSKSAKWFAERLLTMEDVSESFGPMMTATNVFSVNRDPIAKAANRLTLFIDKSRSSETGFAIVCKTDFSRCITHSNKLGAAWYRGTDSYTSMVDALLADNSGKDITEILYREKAKADK